MSRYYKGAGVGTYWHVNNAMLLGFTPASPGIPQSATLIKDHIVHQLVPASPYVSLTRSYEVAETYAKHYGRNPPSATNPAYVYELDVPNSGGANLIDPIQELSKSLGTPFAQQFYQHNRAPDVLLGLVDSAVFGHVLTRLIKGPGVAPGHPPSITDDLHALVRALRDSEVLAYGVISRNCLVLRHSIH